MGNGDDDLMHIFALGHQLAIVFAALDLRFPPDGLDRWRELFPSQLEVTTALGRIPICPGAFDQRTTAHTSCQAWSCSPVDAVPQSHIPKL